MLNAEIEECIENVRELCSLHQVPMLLAIQETPLIYRALGANENLAVGDKLRNMRMLLRASDIDEFLRALIREAQHNGHQSVILRAMGIAEEPRL